jgi:hypothetical protein
VIPWFGAASTNCLFYEDGVASGAQSVDASITTASVMNGLVISYINDAGGGGGPVVPVISAGLRQRMNN